jgi:Rv2525c-like, glycoside hydrolase-like domain
MRRAVVTVIIGGYAFWGIGSGLGHQPVIDGARLTAAVKPAKAAEPASQTVTFGGYTVSVPASWPVYDLTKNPRQCVRYDVHAVYLGTPGPDPNCPPNLVGRVDTLTIQAPTASAGTKTAGNSKGPRQDGPQALNPGTIVQDPDRHELALAMPDKAPSIGATYGTGPGATEQMLATVRQASTKQAVITQAAITQASTTQAGPERTGDSIRSTGHPVVVRAAAHVTARNPAWPKAGALTGPGASWLTPPSTPASSPSASKFTPKPKRTSAPKPKRTSAPKPTPKPTGPVLASNPSPVPTQAAAGGTLAGFDTCAAPSLPTMKAWRAKYAATAIYIGGQMMACGQSNLSASWVQQTEAMGYALMPTFVGLQAPCDSFSGRIDPKQAASQGTAAANQAVTAAKSYGLGAGTPIYYDMEAYNHTNAGCRTAVLTFLDAWTRQLKAVGYISGVYSSAGSAITDLQSHTTVAGHSLAEPQAIWFALWDNGKSMTGAPYMTSAVWPVASRSKQYAGNRVVKVGGISLNIDADWVAGAVARR